MSILLSSLLALSAQTPMLKPLECGATEAYYTMPGDEIWAVNFTKPKHPPSAASDLLMTITGVDFVRDFAFTSAQGFGGTSLLVTEDDEEAGQPMPAAEQPADSMAFHAFTLDEAGGLVRMADAPTGGGTAPVAIYIPDVSRYFWYDDKYVDIETGKTLDEPVDMPQGVFIGHCLKKR